MIRHRYVKIERGIVPKEMFDRVLPRHHDYVRELERQGRRVTDGYWGERGGGMMIFDAASLDDARAVVAADPLVAEGCVETEVREWCLVFEPVSPSRPGFHHAALRVAEIARSERFYVEAFDMRVEWRPDADNVYLTGGADNLALHRVDRLRDPREPDASLDHLGFVVRERDDVDRFATRLQARGVAFLHPVKDHRDGARSCYVLDPDGNTIQILFHPPLSSPASS